MGPLASSRLFEVVQRQSPHIIPGAAWSHQTTVSRPPTDPATNVARKRGKATAPAAFEGPVVMVVPDGSLLLVSPKVSLAFSTGAAVTGVPPSKLVENVDADEALVEAERAVETLAEMPVEMPVEVPVEVPVEIAVELMRSVAPGCSAAEVGDWEGLPRLGESVACGPLESPGPGRALDGAGVEPPFGGRAPEPPPLLFPSPGLGEPIPEGLLDGGAKGPSTELSGLMTIGVEGVVELEPAPGVRGAVELEPAPGVRGTVELEPAPGLRGTVELEPAPGVRGTVELEPAPGVRGTVEFKPAPGVRGTVEFKPAPGVRGFVPFKGGTKGFNTPVPLEAGKSVGNERAGADDEAEAEDTEADDTETETEAELLTEADAETEAANEALLETEPDADAEEATGALCEAEAEAEAEAETGAALEALCEAEPEADVGAATEVL